MEVVRLDMPEEESGGQIARWVPTPSVRLYNAGLAPSSGSQETRHSGGLTGRNGFLIQSVCDGVRACLSDVTHLGKTEF